MHSIYTIENVSDFSASTENGTEADYRTADNGNIVPRDSDSVKRQLKNLAKQKKTEVFKTPVLQKQNPTVSVAQSLIVYHKSFRLSIAQGESIITQFVLLLRKERIKTQLL